MGTGDEATTDGRSGTSVERRSDRELVMTRRFEAAPRRVYAAWTTPGLFKRWWAPRSSGVPLRACDMDVRVGGQYRIEFGHDADSARAFFGRYVEVVPDARLGWTNEEGGDQSVTTVTFEEQHGGTLLTCRELYPSKQALDESIAGMEGATPEQHRQLDELLAELGPDG